MKLAVVTCTGKRPLMLPLCSRWVRHQTRKPDLWIISLGEGEDLGDTEIPPYAVIHRWNHDIIGLDLHGQIDTNSKYQIEVMRQVPDGFAAAYFDDDDWYGPTYLETVEQQLHSLSITGNGLERRYSLELHRWMEISKSGCNAGAVAMRSDAIHDWIEWLQDPSTKWDWLIERHLLNLRNGAPRVSIKHGPGIGHLFPPAMRKWREQAAPWSKLREWIGTDVEHYIELLK